jgi:Zn-dependent protease
MEPDTIIKLFVIGLVVYATSLHEMAHAYVATWCGDPTPGRHGRLTWNPIPHLQPVITAVVLPVLFYMTSRSLFCLAQTPIDPSRMRRPLRDHALTALAGPVTNFLFMGLLIGILWIPGMYTFNVDEYGRGVPANYLTAILPEAAKWNLILGVFNLLPIPPLDGYRIARAFVPLPARRAMDDFARSSISMMVVLIAGSYIIGLFIPQLNKFFQTLLPTPVFVDV